MKIKIRFLILLGLLLQANVLTADIFRSQDSDGHIRFSDESSAGATLIESTQIYRYKQKVAYVYDGDTITLESGERVRLLGINTPEIESRYRKKEVGGQAAKKWLQEELSRGEVLLEYDQLRHDKYGRVLAHLFLADGEHLNKAIIQAGLATLNIVPPNIRYLDELRHAELQAKQQGIGIWSMKAYQPISVEKLPRNVTGWRRFLATPSDITQSRNFVRLILNNKVDVRIARENLALFPDLDFYLGKSLEVRGWASKNKGHYSILVRHPSAISLL